MEESQQKIVEQALAQQSQQVQSVQSSRSAPKASTSTGSGAIDKFLSPAALKFLPCVKKGKEKEPKEEEEDKGDEVMITGVSVKTEPKKYIPKVVAGETAGVQNVVLMEIPKTQKSSKKQRGPPVPEGRRDLTRFYCENCDANYNHPDELVRHQQNDCGKVDPEFFCDECGKGFAKENGVREHYYHEHTNIKLWYCQKCGDGFHFKSNKSKHLKVCPLHNGPDQYVPRAPLDPVLEATFKKRAAVPVQVVQQPQQVAAPQQVANPLPPQQAVVNPALVIQPEVDDQQPEVQDQPLLQPEKPTQDPQEATPYDEEAEKAVKNIEGEELLNILAGGIIPDATKFKEEGNGEEGNGEEKPKALEVDMHFDD